MPPGRRPGARCCRTTRWCRTRCGADWSRQSATASCGPPSGWLRSIRESTLEGLDTAARKGKHGGRPPVITDDMLHTLLRRRAGGECVEQIQLDLIIPTVKRKGGNPSVAGIYRAVAEPAKRERLKSADADASQRMPPAPSSR
ncbi:hypothetical protein [Streptomyces griseoluteus]|uniref:hypothetical protein n=2 Tax=Streptomyces griseoluteus TaxID=29306 RepID=UPI003403CC8D